MNRIAWMVLRLFWRAPYYLFLIWKCGRKKDPDFEENFKLIKKVTCAANRAGNVTIDARGMENIPKKKGFVFFPNHQGLFDVLVFLESCPVPFSFVIKKEASKIILLKQVVAALDALPMDRSNLRQSMQVIQEMTRQIQKGRNYVIFPEGTRSKKGNRLIDFKPGAFKCAVKAKCPIVPCALIDSYKPFDEKSIQNITVTLYYLPPIEYEEYHDMSTVEIAEMVKARIEKTIEEHLKRLTVSEI